MLQSIGGGGGIVADNSDSAIGTIKVGNSADSVSDTNGSAAGNGGVTTISGNASITTFGTGGHAVIMQSIGGGGGIGGAGTSSENAFGASSIDLEVGGNGSSTGTGGDVTLAEGSYLGLQTNGDHSYGILAQSIGGGGGLGAVVDPQSVFFAGGNKGANQGGNVTLNLGDGFISTTGINSHAVVAQSIGAGGGIAAYSSEGNFSISPNQTGALAVGDGGNVYIALNAQGSLTTSGVRAHGILVQSIGGGGGILNGVAGFSKGGGNALPGNISVEVDGTISVTGEGSYGIFAQQDAPGNNGVANASLRVGGMVVSQDAAVVMDSRNGQIQIDAGGLIQGPVAIQSLGAAQASLKVTNNGTLDGSIVDDSNLVSGSGVQGAKPSQAALASRSALGSITLLNTGEFIAGPLVQADVTNRGLLRLRELTRLEGTLVQESDGTILAETDFASEERGRLVVDGDADLSGSIQVAGTNVNGNREVEILRVVNGDFNNTLEVDGDSSRLFRYTLRRSGNRLLVRAAADFSPSDLRLSDNAVSAGDYLERAFQAQGNEGLIDLFAVLEDLAADGRAYEDALNQLTPGAGLAFATREVWAQQSLAEEALGEKVLRGDSARPVEVQSMWAKTSGGSYGADTYDLDSYSSMVGGQWEYSPDFFIGGAIGYRSDNLKSDDGTVSGDGDAILGALTVKYEPGDWSFAAALTGSFSSNDTTRRIPIPGQAAELDGSPDHSGFGLLGQVGYTFHNKTGYVRPMLTAGIVHVRADDYTERGASDLRLQIQDESQTALVVTPGVEAGIRSDLPNGMTLRSYVSGGVSFSTVDEFEQRSRFVEGPAGIGSFNTSLPQDDIVARVEAGFQMQFTDALSGYLQYQGEFSDTLTSNGAGLGLRMEF